MVKEKEEPKGFKSAKAKAQSLLSNKEKLSELFEKGKKKANERAKSLDKVKKEFSDLFRLIQAYIKKEYTKVPTKTIIYAVAAVVYFVNPLDLIPDFILFTGLLDDITVISFVVNSIRNDIDEFLLWEKEKTVK